MKKIECTLYEKFIGKSIPENDTLFFGKKYVFRHFTTQNALKPIQNDRFRRDNPGGIFYPKFIRER